MAIFVTAYCGKAHRLSDGRPVRHRCRQLLPEGLLAERRSDLDTMLYYLELRPWVLCNDDIDDDGLPDPELDLLSQTQ